MRKQHPSRTSNKRMIPGRDYIGVGVGAMIFNADGLVFLSRRGPAARNERGCWEFPGGRVEFGERLVDAIVREFREEYDMRIEIDALLSVFDHLLPDEQQHWISPTFIGRHVGGEPRIVEPEKCSAIGWFALDTLPAPLSMISQDNLLHYRSGRKD